VLDLRFKDVVIKGTRSYSVARSLIISILDLYSPFSYSAVLVFVEFKTDGNLNRKLNVE